MRHTDGATATTTTTQTTTSSCYVPLPESLTRLLRDYIDKHTQRTPADTDQGHGHEENQQHEDEHHHQEQQQHRVDLTDMDGHALMSPASWAESARHGCQARRRALGAGGHWHHASFVVRASGAHDALREQIADCLSRECPRLGIADGAPLRVRLRAPHLSKLERITDKDISCLVIEIDSDKLSELRSKCTSAVGAAPWYGGAGHISVCYFTTASIPGIMPLLSQLRDELTGFEFEVNCVDLETSRDGTSIARTSIPLFQTSSSAHLHT
ncbi:hypothetical protein Pelo_13025 [Pelomyxa schiedti]|nr:hypothetical protein Pelo_13025 [Pelomyxa schiedti]